MAGASAPCRCEDGTLRAQVCGAEGIFGLCDCREERCVPGRVEACACGDVSSGTRACTSSGVFEACACPTFDAGAPPDAGCDPYERACACPVEPAPRTPTLTAAPSLVVGTGPQNLLDVFVHASGILVVTGDGVVRLSREGVELGRWAGSARELRAADLLEDTLVVADRSYLTVLSPTLEVVRTFPVEPLCVHVRLDGCGRLTCFAPTRRAYVFDVTTGRELADMELRYTADGYPRRVPGVDAFVLADQGSFPGHYDYLEIQSDGMPYFHGEGRAPESSGTSRVFGFVGDPATSLITAEGQALALPACWSASSVDPRPCFASEATWLDPTTRFIAMDSTTPERIRGIVGPRYPTDGLDECGGACRLTQLDADDASVLTSRTLAYPMVASRVWLRHDPWADRAVIARMLGCSDYPDSVCHGWEVRLEQY